MRARESLIYVHVLLGLAFIPLGLGSLDVGDFLARLPAVAVVGVDACIALQIAIVYSRDIWPHRARLTPRLQEGLFAPWVGWLAAGGYYMTCLWVVMAIIARPDAQVNWAIIPFFVGGYFVIAIYKFAKLRLAEAVAHELAEGLDG